MKTNVSPYGLHWFRRDLRADGNFALDSNLNRNDGRVVGVFFFDSSFLSRADFSHNRFGFFLRTLQALREDLRDRGGDLWVLDAEPLQGFRLIFEKLRVVGAALPGVCTFNRDYEPFARSRDARVEELLQEGYGVPIATEVDHLVIEPNQLRRPDGGTYQIFTPFARAWSKAFQETEALERIRRANHRTRPFGMTWQSLFGASLPVTDALESFVVANQKHLSVSLPAAGSVAAQRSLERFTSNTQRYAHTRDFPAQEGTSGLSIYLKNGSLTSAQIFAKLESSGAKRSPEFQRQLIWREFYYHILHHHPRVESESFRAQYNQLDWSNRLDWFEAWKQGQTGFPLVDAGMRELLATGLMHNRLRMVVASFLTKDLLIDWRWGEAWFMQNLLDGDLAANNGGWQWAASTGCDPQPYFRVFNPELQSRRFDPQGSYIRKHLPELAHLSDRDIHAPPPKLRGESYPAPMINHATQKQAALQMFKRHNRAKR